MTFDGLTLAAAPGLVMTPRLASEQLIAAAARFILRRRARVADVGTGSGALAIAIATRFPNAEVWASDSNCEAYRLAASPRSSNACQDELDLCVTTPSQSWRGV